MKEERVSGYGFEERKKEGSVKEGVNEMNGVCV